jgi:hypothetical protein
MTDNSFSRQAEKDLRASHSIGNVACQAWERLAPGPRAAFARAMEFLGCPSRRDQEGSVLPSEQDRIAATRLMLLKLGLDRDDPRWSSTVLERLTEAVMQTPGGAVSDVFSALLGVLEDYPGELSKEVANFIKDMVIRCFTAYRYSYNSVDWPAFVREIAAHPTKPKLYLALHAVPPEAVSPDFAEMMVKGLESTPYHEEAASILAA